MEMPWRCGTCLHENMVDLDSLAAWPVDRLVTAEGFVCEICGTREVVLFMTASLQEAERKLTRYRPGHSQFQFLFAKLLRKALGVNERGATLWRDRTFARG